MKKSFILFFPVHPLQEVHLKKDPGVFTKYFDRYYFHGNTEIVTVPDEEHTITNISFSSSIKFLYGKKSIFFRIKFHSLKHKQIFLAFLSFIYLLNHKHSHIMTFHATYYSYTLLLLTHFFLPNIKTYLKTDTSDKSTLEMIKLVSEGKKSFIYKWIFSHINIISVETDYQYGKLKNNVFFASCKNVFLIPNGLDNDIYSKYPVIKDKKNILLTVGRIGSFPKNSELLFEIIANLKLKDWIIELIGPVEDSFSGFIKSFLNEHSEYKNNLIICGNISDSSILRSKYEKAKIFIFTSRFESFGLAPLEAAAEGDYIVSTDVGCIQDITDKGRLGFISPESKQDSQNYDIIRKNMTEHLQSIIDGTIDISENYTKQADFIRRKFLMTSVIELPCFKEWAGN